MSAAASNSTGTSVVYVTVPSMEVAENIAGMLVSPEHRLAAWRHGEHRLVAYASVAALLGMTGTWMQHITDGSKVLWQACMHTYTCRV